MFLEVHREVELTSGTGSGFHPHEAEYLVIRVKKAKCRVKHIPWLQIAPVFGLSPNSPPIRSNGKPCLGSCIIDHTKAGLAHHAHPLQTLAWNKLGFLPLKNTTVIEFKLRKFPQKEFDSGQRLVRLSRDKQYYWSISQWASSNVTLGFPLFFKRVAVVA